VNDVQNFEDEIQAMLADKERAASPAADFVERLQAVPTTRKPRTAHRVDLRSLPRWTPPLLVAAAVAVVAIIGLAITSSPSAHERPGKSNSPIPPKISTPGYFATGVQFRDAQHGYAIGNVPCATALHYCATLLRTDNGGATWTKLSLPSGLRPADDQGVEGGASCTSQGRYYGPCVDQVLFADADHGYVWSNHSFYSSNDGGQTWHDGKASYVRDLVLVGNDVVRVRELAACSTCPSTIERSRVGTTSWSDVTPVKTGIVNARLVGAGPNVEVDFLNASIDDPQLDKANWVFYRSTDGGGSWLKIDPGCHGDVADISGGFDGSLAASCGGAADTTVRVLASGTAHFGPAHPAPRVTQGGSGSAPANPYTRSARIIARSASDLLAFAQPNTLAETAPWTEFESTDGGATWNLVGGIAPWTPIDAITGYQLGPFGTYFPLDPNAFTSLRITTDAGRTFKTYSFAIQ